MRHELGSAPGALNIERARVGPAQAPITAGTKAIVLRMFLCSKWKGRVREVRRNNLAIWSAVKSHAAVGGTTGRARQSIALGSAIKVREVDEMSRRRHRKAGTRAWHEPQGFARLEVAQPGIN